MIYVCTCGCPLQCDCVPLCAGCGLPVAKCDGGDCVLAGEQITYVFREHELTDALKFCPDCGEVLYCKRRVNLVMSAKNTTHKTDQEVLRLVREALQMCRSPK